MGVRTLFVRGGLAIGVVLGLVLWSSPPAPATTPGPPCGEKTISSPTGVGFRILFANNGAVQQYIVTAKSDNTELVNDARISLEGTYGPAGVNAPALKVISFKPSPNGGGMMVPDKAIDSCGRTLDFN